MTGAMESFDQTLTIDATSHRPLTVVLALSGLQEHVSVEAPSHRPAGDGARCRRSVSRRLIDTLPSESVSAGLSSLVTLTTPGVAADSNGGFHPLGEHAETSFSVDNQPITDQQSRTFSNQLSQNAIQSLDVLTGVPPAEFGDKTSLIVKATTRSGLGVRRPTGSVSLGYGSFTTPTASLALGAGSQRVGNFVAIDGLASGRFLDTPEIAAASRAGRRLQPLRPVRRASLGDDDRATERVRRALRASRRPTRSISRTRDRTSGSASTASMWRRRSRERSALAPSLELNAWLRRDVVEYDPQREPVRRSAGRAVAAPDAHQRRRQGDALRTPPARTRSRPAFRRRRRGSPSSFRRA